MGSFAPHFRCDAERRTVKDEIAVFAILRLFCPLARMFFIMCRRIVCRTAAGVDFRLFAVDKTVL